MENLTDEKQRETSENRRRKAEEILMEVDKHIQYETSNIRPNPVRSYQYSISQILEAAGQIGASIHFNAEKWLKRGLSYHARFYSDYEAIDLEDLDGKWIGGIEAEGGDVWENMVEDKTKITITSPAWKKGDGITTESNLEVNGKLLKEIRVRHSAQENADDVIDQIYHLIAQSKQKAAEQNKDSGREI